MKTGKSPAGVETGPTGYTRSDWLVVSLAVLTLAPFVLVRFFGLGGGSPFLVAGVTGLAIVAAAFFLSWAVEGLETIMSQALALAILAIIEVAPEFAFEIILAWRQQVELVAASVTGVIRLLLGVGWPLVVFVAYFSARRKGQTVRELQLDARQSVELLYLLAASAYALVITLKGTLSVIDTAVLGLLYVLYLYTALRAHGGAEEEEEAAAGGIWARTKQLQGALKWVVIAGFLACGAFVLYFGTEPFIDAVLEIARGAGVSEFVLIQWVAPFLSEVPESLTAYLFAATVVFAGVGLRNLIASKLTQLTLLFAALPVVYGLSVGEVTAVQLTSQSVQEIFLAAARVFLSAVLLLNLRFGLKKAFLFLFLFVIEFSIPLAIVRLALGWLYLVLAVLYLVIYRRELWVFKELGKLWS